MLDQVKKFVNESFNQGNNEKSMAHFEQAVYWLKILKPDADEPMQIAAYAHDIGRAFRKTNTAETFKDKEFNDPHVLAEHGETGARIISEFLKNEGYNKEAISRIYNMVRYHEEGGDVESDLIKDADSLSYLEVNAPKFVEKLVKPLGKEKIKRKIDWMYNRISSMKAKELAKLYYNKAIKLLENS